jgi:chromate reductase
MSRNISLYVKNKAMKYLLFSGSLRTESLNKKLVAVADKIISGNKSNEISVADIRSLSIPVYDGDIETAGIPDGVRKLGSLIQAANAIVISSPEYNSSVAGPLKNMIDWVSRLKPMPFTAKPVLLLGASPGAFGAVRALGVTRAPLEALGSYVYPQTFALPKAHEAFTAEGALVDSGVQKRLEEILAKFAAYAEKLA